MIFKKCCICKVRFLDKTVHNLRKRCYKEKCRKEMVRRSTKAYKERNKSKVSAWYKKYRDKNYKNTSNGEDTVEMMNEFILLRILRREL